MWSSWLGIILMFGAVVALVYRDKEHRTDLDGLRDSLRSLRKTVDALDDKIDRLLDHFDVDSDDL
jgi:hypothetical protein